MKKKKNASFIILIVLLACFLTGQKADAQLPQEIRGVWLTTVANIDFPSKQGLNSETLKRELDDIVNTVAECGLNTIFFQVRPTCDALYNSKIFPTSKWLVGKQGNPLPNGFDPLAYLIAKARSRGISVHAWVNPMRVTFSKGSLVSQVAQNSPALQHPEWVVSFDGKYYFDVGMAEVRTLIAEGVKEIVQNYDVAGVVFDDYFYPTEGKNVKFNDEKTFAACGAGSVARSDWRRQNVNSLIRECYETVKSVRPDCLFGVSPAGIWQNKKDNPIGSDTNGKNAYRDYCCDALAWMKGGYVDYISPQIYWNFTQKNARFDTLCRWWNANCDATGVPLVVSHATYRVTQWQSAKEIANQVSFARQLRQYGGSVFYSYKDLKKNTLGLREVIRKIMEQNYTSPVSRGNDFNINTPCDKQVTKHSGLTILGQSNMDSPLFFNGIPVSRTRSGFFCIYTPLASGENRITFEQGQERITKNVFYKCGRNGVAAVTKSRNAMQKETCVSIPLEVTKNGARFRSAPDSSMYQDFSPLLLGMRDMAIAERGPQYKLRMGGFVAKEDVKVTGEEVAISNLTGVSVQDAGSLTNISLVRDIESPIDARVRGDEFVVTVFNSTTNLRMSSLPPNPLFKTLMVLQDKNCVKLHFKLCDTKNFYGFTVSQGTNGCQISLRNPSTLARGAKPLLGKRIVLDAGHGGADSGALGSGEAQNEEHLNLAFVLCLKEKLESLGAEIILTRSSDREFKLLERANFVKQQEPDLAISLHHNSAEASPRILETSGFLALYTDPAGKALAEIITKSVAKSVFCRYTEAKFQRLAMCRFNSFPSVLLELGFVTSPEDVEKASNPKERDNICEAIVEAILDFYRKQEVFMCVKK